MKSFPDPIGRDAVLQWPGGINMQLYWHTAKPSYDALQTIPKNRVYVPADRASDFVNSFVRFSKGSVVSDNAKAPGVEVGRPDDTYRRIRITSKFGAMTVLVTDGILPYPYGHETTGYEVLALDETLAKAKAAGTTVLVDPYVADARRAAVVKFPGGYVAEIHSTAEKLAGGQSGCTDACGRAGLARRLRPCGRDGCRAGATGDYIQLRAEDWSVLANPALRTQPFDGLKYIPLFITDPKSYVSLGANLRERFETNDAPGFGVGKTPGDSYLLQRLQMHADIHLNENWQMFMQLEDVRAIEKASISSTDQNQLNVRLAFVAYTNTFADGIFRAQVGRQDFAFDLQRFVSSRDGPNVRQSFDAVWADFETGAWRFIGFVSQPVQYRFGDVFDDVSNGAFRFSTLRIERKVFGDNELSGYYALYERSSARYLDASGDESRHIFDVRFAGASNRLDWDLEAMAQTGNVGAKDINAWALGGRTGYTLANVGWTPRIGLQADAASGDRHPGDGNIGTFNPLFPNGYYFSLGGYTGYANLIHIKPTLTVKPADRLTVTAGVGFQWRQTVADAVYVQPNIAVAGTAGRGDRWTGMYSQLRMDYAFNANLTGALEAVHYAIGDTVRDAGRHDSNYLGLELKYGW